MGGEGKAWLLCLVLKTTILKKESAQDMHFALKTSKILLRHTDYTLMSFHSYPFSFPN